VWFFNQKIGFESRRATHDIISKEAPHWLGTKNLLKLGTSRCYSRLKILLYSESKRSIIYKLKTFFFTLSRPLKEIWFSQEPYTFNFVSRPLQRLGHSYLESAIPEILDASKKVNFCYTHRRERVNFAK